MTPPVQIPLITTDVPPDSALDLGLRSTALGHDERLVYDTLCVLQAPSSQQRLAEMMDAGGLRTRRGTKFHPPELRDAIRRLVDAGLVTRDFQGRMKATLPQAQVRLHSTLCDPALASAWFDAWCQLTDFEHSRGLVFQDEEQLAAALRLVLYGGRTLVAFQRLRALTAPYERFWNGALRAAVLEPFDAELFSQLDPALQQLLADTLLSMLSGFTEAGLAPLEDWLLARLAEAPDSMSPTSRGRLAETLLFRGEFARAAALCNTLDGAGVQLLQAALKIAQGQWQEGAIAFEAALKQCAAQTGRRKNLVTPSVGWLYLMALLAQADPAAWGRARKFAASESGKREAHPLGFWGVWQTAIDQRLGDAPKAPNVFELTPPSPTRPGGLQSLQALHHLLLAAWLRVEPAKPALLRALVDRLTASFEAARMGWLARLTRRAAAVLMRHPPPASDADAPFFVGDTQEGWRDTLASILALAPPPASGAARDNAAADRLIWVVSSAADGRIAAIGAMEQKAGPRGLGKPKAVSLATLQKRDDLPPRDMAVLRAVQKEEYAHRQSLDVVAAAPALLNHPHVAWLADPLRFIEVSEALPRLEVMTQGEHIDFGLVDPLRSEAMQADEAQDALLPQRWRQQRVRMRNTLLLADGDRHARLIRLSAAQLRIAELVAQGWKVPTAARAELDAALRVLATHFQVASDAEAGHDVEPDTMLRAELTPHGQGWTLRLLAAPFGDFGPRLPPGAGRARVTTVHQGATLSTQRDLAIESAGLQRLLNAVDGLDGLGDEGHEWRIDDPEQALAVVEALGRLGDLIVTEWPEGKPMRVRSVPDAAVQVRARSKGEWLELEGRLQLDDGQVLQLRQLLDLMEVGRSRYVALADGDFLALGDALRQQLADLAALAQRHKSGSAQTQRLSTAAALAWEASGHSLTLEGDAAWRKRSDAWATAHAQVPAAPAGLQADLRDYQLEGYRWLARLAASGFGAILADDMGLGKTVQTLALLLQRAAGGPALVVAPTSVCGNWLAEATRFAPGLQVALYGDMTRDGAGGVEAGWDELSETEPNGDGRTSPSDADGHAGESVDGRSIPPGDAAVAIGPSADTPRRAARSRQVRALGPRQLLVCSYALLQIDADILASLDWHTVVLDEAQAIKNPGTARTRAALALRSDFRLALTGTPIENRLGELWSIMGFANPGLLGSAEQFNRRYATPIEHSTDAASKAQAARRLRRLLSPFLLRRSKAEVLTDLPARTEIVHEVVPEPKERAFLEALRQQAEASVADALSDASQGAGQRQFHVLAALTRLRRAACDPRLVVPELGMVGAKVREFERLAVELVAGRHKALVFSQFTDFLKLLRDRLDLAGLAYQYLDGSTPAAERNKRVTAFKAGTGDLFLISLKAGGFGLNLTEADYVIIADPWWNPAVEEQASARAHRMGQQRPVTVYRLVTQGSIEEKIVRLHRSKRDLADGILSGEDAGVPIDAGQLLALLREE